jgi:nitroimidazol reductase NimA-like FMN-containing flavoprotein (pyridoxamine 5'-phosphate oxidase superfamily)
MEPEDALRLLEIGEYGILSTVDGSGQPYGVPLNYAAADGAIYLHCTNAGGHKYDNIVGNNKVSFAVVGNTQVVPEKFGTLFESVIAFGEASVVEDEAERMTAFQAIIKKYSPEFLADGEQYIAKMSSKTLVLKIKIERLTGKHKVQI